MKDKFDKLDVNKKGKLTMEDFLYYPEISTHPFSERIYYLIQ